MTKQTGKRFRATAAGRACIKSLVFTGALLCLYVALPAQTISATLDRDKIVLGEQVTLELKLDGLNAAAAFVTGWFNLPDSDNHIQIVRKDTIDTIEVNGFTSYLQHVTLTSFDSGRWALLLPRLTVQDKTTGKKTMLKADSVYLQVLPVDVSGLEDYHAMKEIIEVPAKANYSLLFIALPAIALVALAILLLRRKKAAPVPQTAQEDYVHPLDEALRKIQELRLQRLDAAGQTQLLYLRLDEICRHYFERRAGIKPRQNTGDELVANLSVYLQDAGMNAKCIQLMQLVDAVKFAKYLPNEQQNGQALQLAAQLLQHIDNQLQLVKRNANGLV